MVVVVVGGNGGDEDIPFEGHASAERHPAVSFSFGGNLLCLPDCGLCLRSGPWLRSPNQSNQS